VPGRLLGASQQQKSASLDELVAMRASELAGYQDEALAGRYRARVAAMRRLEEEKTPGCSGLAEAVARGYFKLLAIKDEYEIARLFADVRFEAMLKSQFEGTRAVRFHLAPPILARRDKRTGEPRKITLGAWMLPVMRLLAKGKRLRGSWADVFGHTRDRRLERRMIGEYEALLEEIGARLSHRTHRTACELAALPLAVRGFGHVKRLSYDAAKEREADLLAELRNPSDPARLAAE
jgi:indolepyruvate ferredoxin oxidoreductase